MLKLRAFFAVLVTATAVLAAATSASADLSDVPTPAVSGPVPKTADSYPFLSTDIDLSKYGYVEEEFFIQGDGSAIPTFWILPRLRMWQSRWMKAILSSTGSRRLTS